MKLKMIKWLGAVLLLSGCATLQQEQIRDLDRMADRTMAKLTLEFSGLQAELSASAGYLVLERSGSGIPLAGKKRYGVLVDNRSDQRVYVRVKTLEIDGGWGVGDYTGLFIIKDKTDFEQAARRGWTSETPGRIYVYAGREKPTSYPIKQIAVDPL